MNQDGRDGDNGDERLTVEELGQLALDITLSNPTEVVLDNPTKLETFRSLRADIERAIEQGYMIDIPD